MLEIIVSSTEIYNNDPCCGGAYDYDNDSNCVDDQ